MEVSSDTLVPGSGESFGRKPNISIALATYNGDKYIADQLESLANQTHSPFELVVTDDVSTDSTYEIVLEFARAAPFKVHIHRNERRLGVLQNFLKAANLCQGESIAFCDQDDIWLPQKLETCARWLFREDVSLISHAAFLIDEDGKRTGHAIQSRSRTTILRPNSMEMNFALWGFTILFKKDLLRTLNSILTSNSCPPIPSFVLHDTLIQSLAPIYGKTILLTDELALYRQHSGMVTNGIRTKPIKIFAFDAQVTRAHLQRKCIQFKFFADCLGIVCDSDDPSLRSQSLKGKRRYELFERRSRRRMNLYKNDTRILRKIMCLAELITCGDYAPGFIGGFGPRGLFRDISSLGLVLAKKLKVIQWFS